MSIALFNPTLVAVSCELTSRGHVVRVADDHGLQHELDVDETVFVELVAPGLSQPPKAVVTIRVETMGAEDRDTYVWEETASGCEQWARDTNGYAYRTYVAPADASLRMVTLPKGSPPPAVPPPGSGEATLRVKVRRAGSLPLTSSLMTYGGDSLGPLESKQTQPRYRVLPHTASLRPGFEHANFNELADELDDAAILERLSRRAREAP
jgi:hypothetical protein